MWLEAVLTRGCRACCLSVERPPELPACEARLEQNAISSRGTCHKSVEGRAWPKASASTSFFSNGPISSIIAM
jgi:hypothetical protein